jgi:transcriptional regulator with AbiEi antitoxin domain of type IV toxin-antitoxin system
MTVNAQIPLHSRGIVADFVDSRQQRGQYTFTGSELAAVSHQTALARRAALMRLRKRGRIVRPLPRHDFFVIVPHEYHSLGAPPSSWYLDSLMRYLGLPAYYVGLLTAAQWQGASHFAVQETQVIVPKQMRPIQVGREKIRFFMKADAANTPVETRTLEYGPIRVSTPEATAVDLVRYIDAAGGLNFVATVLADLKKDLKPGVLKVTVAKGSNVATAQRLGCILERVADTRLTAPLARWLARQHPRTLRLDAGASVKGAALNERWRLWVNADIEPSA